MLQLFAEYWRVEFEEGYEKRFRILGGYFFADFKGKGTVVFDKLPEVEEKHFNTRIRLANKDEYEFFKKKQ